MAAMPGEFDIHDGDKTKSPMSYWDTLATRAGMTQMHHLSWEPVFSHMEQKLAKFFREVKTRYA